jgi:hypothetical protein
MPLGQDMCPMRLISGLAKLKSTLTSWQIEFRHERYFAAIPRR